MTVDRAAYTEETVDYELVTEDGYVVLRLPGREYLFDPLTARNLGAAFLAASQDLRPIFPGRAS